MGDKLSLKGAWSRHVSRHVTLGAQLHLWTRLAEAGVVKFCTPVEYIES